MKTAYDEEIMAAANFYGLPIDLITAQVLHESAGKADAFRYEPAFFDYYIKDKPTVQGFKYGPLAACSYGLMQIVLQVALEDGFDGNPWDLFVPRIGLGFGCKHLRKLWDRLGGTPDTYRTALARYNGTGEAATRYADAIYASAGRVV